MKKTIKLISMLLLILLLLSGCAGNVDVPEVSQPSNLSEASNELTTEPVRVIIDVYDEYWGQYCLMSEVKFEHYDEDGLPDYIWVENPALLAFAVGDEFEGGLGSVEGTSVEYMISHIQEYVDTHALEYDDQQMFEEILNILNNIVVVTGSST